MKYEAIVVSNRSRLETRIKGTKGDSGRWFLLFSLRGCNEALTARQLEEGLEGRKEGRDAQSSWMEFDELKKII